MTARTFTDALAKRERVPLLIGLAGPSGSGKTYSMLRLLTGIQNEIGSEVWVIDTEARRALHYADQFKFRHLDFQAPFSPLDYLAAIEHCVSKGAKIIGIDSASHEHESAGGVLEMHEKELDRLAGDDFKKRERMNFLAWTKPKAQRRHLISAIIQMNVNFVFCFRAREKLKIVAGKEPIPLGWQPIAGEEFVYEMTMALLLPPGSKGVPSLNPVEIGERAMVKVPQQFLSMVKERPLDEELGAELARWAAGGAPRAGASAAAPSADSAALLAQIQAELTRRCPGDERKKDRGDLMRSVLEVKTWKAAQELPPDRLRAALERLAPQTPTTTPAPEPIVAPGARERSPEPFLDRAVPLGEAVADPSAEVMGIDQLAALKNLAAREGPPIPWEDVEDAVAKLTHEFLATDEPRIRATINRMKTEVAANSERTEPRTGLFD